MIGQVVGRYHVLEQLGAGGMGVVYRARDTQLERDVALKFLNSSPSVDETARLRLLREARSISALNHPNICQVFEIAREGDQDFIAMELVEGKPLKERIPSDGMPAATAIRYGAEIASALGHAHERGIIHRDLKSANVMITPSGTAKVLDFGVAKRDFGGDEELRPDLSLTGEGMVVGTPAYFAPEVLRGDKAGASSDIWALGVVLYEMVTGRLPFHGRTLIETCTAIMNEDAPKLPDRLPPGLRSVVQRSLAKEPAHRYHSAGEVKAALEAVHSDTETRDLPAVAERRPFGLAGVAGITIGLSLAAIFGFNAFGLRTKLLGGSADKAAASTIRSLAVLPLANLSGDPSQDYFADGMTEELITCLTPLRDLKVISRTSVLRYKGTDKSMPQIAKELGVDGIIAGSVMRAGDKVRVTAQLLDAAHDKNLWARSYDRTMDEVLTLQRDIASDIAEEIQIQISPGMAAARQRNHPLNTQAYELYLKGTHEIGKLSPASAAQALDYYQQASVLDPDDARFHAGIANACVIQGQVVQSVPLSICMPKAKAAASRALELDPNLAEAHLSYSVALFFVDWDWKGAEEHVKKAIEINPGLSMAHLVYSVILSAQGKDDEAIRENRRALELDPLSLMHNWNLAGVLVHAGRMDEAIAQAHRGLDLFPDSQLMQGSMAGLYEERGDYEAAIDATEKVWPESMGGKAWVAKLRSAYRASGPSGYYRMMLDHMNRMDPKNEVLAYRRAQIYARLGQKDLAFQQLDRALALHLSDMLWVKADHFLDPLHDDPRFPAYVAKVGLNPAI